MDNPGASGFFLAFSIRLKAVGLEVSIDEKFKLEGMYTQCQKGRFGIRL